MDRKKRILSLLVTLAITLACVPAIPTVAPLSTRPAGFVETMVAGTAAAAAKSTQRASSPTPWTNATLLPTHTPGPALSPTATIIFKIPTIKVSSGGGTDGSGGSGGSGGGSSGPPPEMACRISNITPWPGSHMKPNKDFVATWSVSNRGTAGWDENSVDYKYILGAKLHKQPIYDLPFSVPPGATVYLSVAMHSPSAPGVYSSVWAMHASETLFCRLEMKIIVP
ncbi:MAG: hypothetical protein HY867_15180 [Chloroflexi bacterium]|nr:hypothetical protein [Chloroflexota bacterium]